MELKVIKMESVSKLMLCLNRTFYGIESCWWYYSPRTPFVLIVPFMELKEMYGKPIFNRLTCLNRTFYGIESL